MSIDHEGGQGKDETMPSDCDSCRGTGAGMVGTDSKCGSCKGRGWHRCECVEEERQAQADNRRKADIEDRLIDEMEG